MPSFCCGSAKTIRHAKLQAFFRIVISVFCPTVSHFTRRGLWAGSGMAAVLWLCENRGEDFMDTSSSMSCCFCPTACIYVQTCPHPGQIRILDRLSNCPDNAVCFTACLSGGLNDMESFQMMQKMFILKESGYWRLCPRRTGEISGFGAGRQD